MAGGRIRLARAAGRRSCYLAAFARTQPPHRSTSVSSNAYLVRRIVLPVFTQLIRCFRYLKRHDLSTKRLWFLWGDALPSAGKTPAKCGCIGGCAFFGSNRNGPLFFKPSRQDAIEGLNIASFRFRPIYSC